VKQVAAGVAVLVGLTTVAGALAAVPAQASGPVHARLSIAVRQSPAYNGDAGDPNVIYFNGTYYAFTTGTSLGNNLQALIDTTGNPDSGWRSYTGQSYGSTALPSPPGWESPNTQTSPGVFHYGGHWVMWYDAAQAPYQEAQGHSCLSVATAAAISPSSPRFTDTSTGGYCPAGGVLDPSPFIDPATGAAYLIWKSNDGASSAPSQIWSVPLTAQGTGFAGTPTLLLTVDQPLLPWETTTDDPQMIDAYGTYHLLFSGGDFLSTTYNEALATCSGPLGPCTQPTAPFLTTYGSVYGPGGGSFFQDANGAWWLGYAAWSSSCTNYSPCGSIRQLYVAPVDLSNGLVVPCHPPKGTPTGYRMTASDGGIFSFGNLPFCGSTGGITLNQPIVGTAGTSDGGGYWTVASDGGIFSFGDAHFYGSTGNIALNKPIVGMAAGPGGRGYWLVASDGGIFSYGSAGFHGSSGNIVLNKPIVGMASTPDGKGYWLVASDGGIFSYGDAHFYGSTGNIALNKPIVGMASTPDGKGYWLVASDGGIFSYGDAHFYGSTGAITLNKPIVGMAAGPGGHGYWLVASDGGIFSFGDAKFYGSTGNITLNKPIVGMSAS
jgi:hypothetical protein